MKHGSKWIELEEKTMWSDIIQVQKDKYQMFSLKSR